MSRILGRVLRWPFVRVHIWRLPAALEPAGAAVVVANHISHFDPVLLSLAFPQTIDWLTTEEFYSKPFLGALLRALNTIPVDRSRPDHRALRLAVARLRAGRIVGVFPEGGIRAGVTSILGGAAPKSGAAALARIAQVPIIPCVIFGSDRLYAWRSWWPGPPRLRIWIAIGAPLSVSGANGNACLVDALREIGAAAIAHFALQPDDLPATPEHRKGRDAQQLPYESGQ
ncbi:MAG: lysophospholipid acyltransferase family protein [Chthoniobacterales bacterium]